MQDGLDPVVSIRVPRDLLRQIATAVQREKDQRKGDWWRASRTSWILEAIRQRLSKRKEKSGGEET